MSKKLDTVWDAPPHTIAKIAMLKYYLQAWLPILARGVAKPMLYVDGFAGPGYYTNHPEGSPLAALRCMEDSISELRKTGRNAQVTCVFIEEDPRRFESLEEQVRPFKERRLVEIRTFHGQFSNRIIELEREFPMAFRGDSPNFVFADPFCLGITLDAFKRCMAGSRGELLINLDADGISRIYSANNANREKQLDEIFGGRVWETELGSKGLPMKEQARRILHLYKKCLRTIRGVDYVFQFEMRGRGDGLNYYLVYATKNDVAMIKMKEAMARVGQNGQYQFSDIDEDQEFLISENNDEHYAAKLHSEFVGRGKIPFKDVERFVLCETLRISASPLLKILENKEQIEVEMRAGESRRRGTFEREKTAFVTFHSQPSQGYLFA